MRLRDSNKTVFYILDALELHDANEYDHYRYVVKEPCRDADCGCRGNNLVDCIYHCNDGRIVGIEFTQSFERHTGKTTGCGIGAASIITVVVAVSMPMPLLTKPNPGTVLGPDI